MHAQIMIIVSQTYDAAGSLLDGLGTNTTHGGRLFKPKSKNFQIMNRFEFRTVIFAHQKISVNRRAFNRVSWLPPWRGPSRSWRGQPGIAGT